MATLSPNDIAGLIVEVGTFPSPSLLKTPIGAANGKATGWKHTANQKEQAIRWLDTAIAVCLAESGGNTRAKNPSSNARGLWQIMTTAHGDKIAQGVKVWSAELGKSVDILNPYVNTWVAGRVYQEAGNGWGPWEVYSGSAHSYRKRLGHGASAYKYLNNPKRLQRRLDGLMFELEGARGAVAGYADSVNSIGDRFNPLSMVSDVKTFLKDSGIAIGVFLIAAILFIVGFVILFSKSETGKQVTKAATAVASKGLVK